MEGLPICLTVPIGRPDERRDTIHTHEHHELVYVLEGRGRQITDRARYDVRPGRFYLFPAGTPHAAVCADGQAQLLFVFFIPESYFSTTVWERDLASGWSRLLDHCAVESEIATDCETSFDAAARSLVETMTSEFAERRPGYAAALRIRFSELLLMLMRSQWWRDHIPDRVVSPSPRQLIREAESYVRANWYREIRVEEVLAVCNVSRSHFHALFRRHTGCTFVEYLNGVRLEHARTRLVETDLPVGEIAGECGFARPAYFSLVFRERVGVSPREFRAAAKGSPTV